LTDRFSASAQVPDTVQPFEISDFNVQGKRQNDEPTVSMAPTIPAFDEFERPAANTEVDWVPRDPSLETRNRDNMGEPSLGYLFAPFDPGKIEEKKFEEEFKNLPKPDDYKYEQMDTRDTGIVTTLAKANEKAKEIVANAFEQGRRLEEKMLDVAKAEAEEIIKEAQEKAISLAEEAQKNAHEVAEAIAAAARSKLDESEAIKAETDKLKAETEELKKQAEALLAETMAKEASLAPKEEELDMAKAEIDRQRQDILARAAAEGEAAKALAAEKGLAEGRAKGEERGYNESKNEVFSKAQGFFKIIERVDSIWKDLWREKAPFMVTLAVDAAEAIVNKEVKNGQGLAAGAFAACVEYLQKCHRATFRVRPEDLQEIEDARNAARSQIDGTVNVAFKPDPSLGAGDIIMESDAGLLDASLKNRHDRVMAVLRQAIDEGLVAELPPEIPPTPPQVSSQGLSGQTGPSTSPESSPNASGDTPGTATGSAQVAPTDASPGSEQVAPTDASPGSAQVAPTETSPSQANNPENSPK
jgi:flagellar biosynthesis/type III secretory pathway protein FliH/vacuolar-type H+-ATPase subunit H